MRLTGSGKTPWIAAIGLFGAAGAVFLWLHVVQSKPEDRVYRIGWSNSPPFQKRGEDGRATGSAVELLREAARRRGIRLKWVEAANSEIALRAKKVDLWPLIVVTPEREKFIYFAEPYFETSAWYVVRSNSAFTRQEDLANATISYVNLPVSIIRADFPYAHLIQGSSIRGVLDDVCSQRADAAYATEPAAIVSMLNGPGLCANQPLRLITPPHERPLETIGATFEARAAADALREEIGEISAEGQFADILSRGGFFSARVLKSVERLRRARRSVHWLTAGIVSVSFLFLLTLWQAFRIRSERNKAERAEQARRETEERFRTIVQTAPDGIFIVDFSSRFLEVNQAACMQLGYTREELLQRSVYDILPSRFVDSMTARLQGTTDAVETYESCHRRSDGGEVPVELKVRRMRFAGQSALVAIARDVTERKRAEQERARLEEQLRQAQKLESVGRLAGGIAHDFNNLLTVINGYGDLLLKELHAADPFRYQLEEIRKAGERASRLTQQLLAFSRKQVTSPKPLNLNAVIRNSEQMLRRLMGEDIELVTVLSPSLGQMMTDSVQMDQVLINLAANARDAMPNGGTLTVETANAELTTAESRERDEVAAGPYVLLTVTDTGVGMSDDTRQHVFDPFFTTKGVGKGTGLGLSTVYGIVRQSHGYVDVASALGKGTSFKVYLPRTTAEVPSGEAIRPLQPDSIGSETILVVEDQPDVRRLTATILRTCGYQVLQAAGGAEALALASQYAKPIHLLVTDVVMPGMNGRELAERLKALRPDAKVIYTSGYADDLIANRGVHGTDFTYIAKPFSPETLSAKVREVLGESHP